MKKILIIEDNEVVRENTADILELAGYSIATAENGKVGVEKAKQLFPDVIVYDIMMTELDGYEDHGSYIESADILEDIELYEIPKSDFTTLLHTNKDVANKFVRLISNKLVDVQERLINVAFGTVRQRVAKALLDIHNNYILLNKENNGISIAREDFAGLIGTATETAIRMLTQFNDEGLISIGKARKIIIEDKETLEDIELFG